jgi:hypothetical protein
VVTIKFNEIYFVSIDALSSYICEKWGNWTSALPHLEGADLAIAHALANINPAHLQWACDGGVVFDTSS